MRFCVRKSVDTSAVIQRVEEAEVDEMWSYVGKKREPRWLWPAIDHRSGQVLAYVLGRRKDEVFLKRKGLLEPFGITKYDTDYWGASTRHLDADAHQPGKLVAEFGQWTVWHAENEHSALSVR